jgi:FkbM family methyltransferase
MIRPRSQYRKLKRLIGVLVGHDIWQPPEFQCETVSLGNPGAEWAIDPDGLSPLSTIYSFGIGENISFDVDLIRRYGVTVHAFDPTPRVISWLKSQNVPREFVVHEYGISDQDGIAQLYPPEDPLHVSHTILQRGKAGSPVEVPVYTLKTIARMLGHSSIDLLKMDIEGMEYRVLENVLTSGIPVRQVLVEFHHRWPEIGVHQTRNIVVRLKNHGYKIFMVSPNGEEYGFILCERFSGNISELVCK